GPHLEDLGMDVDFAVAPGGAGDDLAVEVDGEDVVDRDLVEADAVRPHEEERGIVRQPAGDVPAGEIVLSFPDEDLPRPNHPFLDLRMRRCHVPAPLRLVSVLAAV